MRQPEAPLLCEKKESVNKGGAYEGNGLKGMDNSCTKKYRQNNVWVVKLTLSSPDHHITDAFLYFYDDFFCLRYNQTALKVILIQFLITRALRTPPSPAHKVSISITSPYRHATVRSVIIASHAVR
ncbi:hypothetical protein E2C01_072832 [Portunus trituberculatus]|uniref:Uncharacterized protein n=1 Tax=Portunus trituberculatus TaxID=210409 RepID=A0A5B7IBR3_PORTR|nr:hypothetical protein [Portunus trituberculatus]